jgi:hypothetical protein
MESCVGDRFWQSLLAISRSLPCGWSICVSTPHEYGACVRCLAFGERDVEESDEPIGAHASNEGTDSVVLTCPSTPLIKNMSRGGADVAVQADTAQFPDLEDARS